MEIRMKENPNMKSNGLITDSEIAPLHKMNRKDLLRMTDPK